MRIPQELKDLLDEASEKNRRSMTAEVVARLQASFDQGSSVHHSRRTPMEPEFLKELERLLDEKLGGMPAVIDTGKGLEKTSLVIKKAGKKDQ